MFALVVIIVIVALIFDYTNGFHDAANAIATSIATRALAPVPALAMAAVGNFVGAFLGQGVAKTVGSGIIDAPVGRVGLVLVLGALVGAICWNMITWWFGLPTSSSQALIGGLVGSAIAASAVVEWLGVVEKVVIPMILSPVVGFIGAYLFVMLLLRMFRRWTYGQAMKRFRIAQVFSAAAMSLGHGLQDAQKTMGIIVLALVVGGYQTGFDIPFWVQFAAAAAISLGTAAGGWRIMRTLGKRIVELDPLRGFSAETVASGVLYTTAFVWNAPISTTQTITGSIMGAGATRGSYAVRWRVGIDIAWAWVLTLPCAAGIAALAFFLLSLILL